VDPRAIVRPEGLSQLKFPLTPSGIEIAAFRRLVVPCLNQVRHHVPSLPPPILLLLAGQIENVLFRKKKEKVVFVICLAHVCCRVHGNASGNDGLVL
jgi:hypothetical protein